jgi:hypothetical protein
MRTIRVWVALAALLVLCSSCVQRDRWAKQRAEFMGTEQLFRVRPPGATGVDVLATRSLGQRGNGVPPKVLGSGGEGSFDLPASISLDEVTDFYVDLLARQGHKNILVTCGDDPTLADRGIVSARWSGHYGYVTQILFGYLDEAVGGAVITSGPLTVRLFVNTSRRMIPTTEEDPALQCGSYPLERMARVLAPYGLVPFRASAEFRSVHGTFGERNKQRTTPPHITPKH